MEKVLRVAFGDVRTPCRRVRVRFCIEMVGNFYNDLGMDGICHDLQLHLLGRSPAYVFFLGMCQLQQK